MKRRCSEPKVQWTEMCNMNKRNNIRKEFYCKVQWPVAGKISCTCPFDSGAAAVCWRSCSAVCPVFGGEGAHHCLWWSAVYSVFSSPPRSQKTPVWDQQQSQLFWLVCPVCWCLWLWCCCPNTQQQRKWRWQQQTGRRSPTFCCTRWRIWASSGNRVCSSPSYTQHQCSEVYSKEVDVLRYTTQVVFLRICTLLNFFFFNQDFYFYFTAFKEKNLYFYFVTLTFATSLLVTN